MKFKAIKTSEFEAKGESHTHYSVAHKGRLLGISTLQWADALTVADGYVTISGDAEVIKESNSLGEVYFKIVPKMDLTLADF